MFTKNLLVKVSAVMLVASMFMASAPAIQANEPEKDNKGNTPLNVVWLSSLSAPAKPAAGMASVFVTNYNGGGALSFDIGDQPNGQIYQVAAASNGLPGNGEIFLAPGTYAYTASSGTMKSVTASITLQAGQVIGLSFSGVNPKTVTIHDNEGKEKRSSHYSPTETFTFTFNQDLKVDWQDLTAMAK